MQEPQAAPDKGRRLRFARPIVVVGGGALDRDLLFTLHLSGAALVGADGGGDVIAENGLTPDAIIGDLDSLDDPEGWTENTEVLHLEEQQTTDFEKVLYSTAAPVTVALGVTGRRFDHTLAALSAVSRYGRNRLIILVDEDDLALTVTGPITLDLDKGARVSVHPLRPIQFSRSAGLLYPLDGLVLEPGGRLGTSNTATETRVMIEPALGTEEPFLVILDRGNLLTLVEALLERTQRSP